MLFSSSSDCGLIPFLPFPPSPRLLSVSGAALATHLVQLVRPPAGTWPCFRWVGKNGKGRDGACGQQHPASKPGVTPPAWAVTAEQRGTSSGHLCGMLVSYPPQSAPDISGQVSWGKPLTPPSTCLCFLSYKTGNHDTCSTKLLTLDKSYPSPDRALLKQNSEPCLYLQP